MDAYKEPDSGERPLPGSGETLGEYRERLRSTPLHLCRLRYFRPEDWTVAFYTYSHMKYEPAMFANGTFYGTPEEGLDIGAVYLQG